MAPHVRFKSMDTEARLVPVHYLVIFRPYYDVQGTSTLRLIDTMDGWWEQESVACG